MCFCQLLVQGERLRTAIQNAVNSNILMIVEKEERIAVRNARMRAGVAWIQCDCLCEHLPRELEVAF